MVEEVHDGFRLLVDSIKDCAMYLVGGDGIVTSWNPGAQAMFGYAVEQILGQPHALLFSSADREAGAPGRMLKVAAEAGRLEETAVRVRNDGAPVWIDQRVIAMPSDGGVACYAVIAHDVSEKRRLEAEREQCERRIEESSRDFEAFNHAIAHDLKAPLRGLNGFTQILVEEYAAKLDAEGTGYCKRILAATGRMSMLVDGLLGLARLTRGPLQLQLVDVTAQARQVISQLAGADPGRSVDVAIEDGLRTVADPRLLRIVLDHLIGNAWKFTGPQPSPRISIGMTDGALFVRDNGVGFDMEHAAKLFKPFERLHSGDAFPGAGVGLALVKRIVIRHGGKIWLTAQAGAGATAYVKLAEAGQPRS